MASAAGTKSFSKVLSCRSSTWAIVGCETAGCGAAAGCCSFGLSFDLCFELPWAIAPADNIRENKIAIITVFISALSFAQAIRTFSLGIGNKPKLLLEEFSRRH